MKQDNLFDRKDLHTKIIISKGDKMIAKVKKGVTAYGLAIGIMVTDDDYPCIPGDVRNATTYDFPVHYEKIPGLDITTVTQLVSRFPVEKIIQTAKKLESAGVKAICGECGYLAIYQREVAASVSVPVFISSLMQVPMVAQSMGPSQSVGIVMAEEKHLTWDHLSAVGITKDTRIKIFGNEDDGRAPAFTKIFYENTDLDIEEAKNQILNNVKGFVSDNPDIGALVLECTSYPPYASFIQEETGLPVFDYYTMIEYVYQAVCHKKFQIL